MVKSIESNRHRERRGRLLLIVSPSLAPGQWLVGAFSQGTLLFVREAMTIAISFENEDDFVNNLATIRAEERCALAVPVPAALLKGVTAATAQNAHVKK